MNADYKRIIDGFREEAKEDIVGLWQVIKEAKRLCPAGDSTAVTNLTLTLVRKLLTANFEAGDPPYSVGGYKAWLDQNPDAVIARIEHEWNALGREPNIGDICWFRIPATSNSSDTPFR